MAFIYPENLTMNSTPLEASRSFPYISPTSLPGGNIHPTFIIPSNSDNIVNSNILTDPISQIPFNPSVEENKDNITIPVPNIPSPTYSYHELYMGDNNHDNSNILQHPLSPSLLICSSVDTHELQPFSTTYSITNNNNNEQILYILSTDNPNSDIKTTIIPAPYNNPIVESNSSINAVNISHSSSLTFSNQLSTTPHNHPGNTVSSILDTSDSGIRADDDSQTNYTNPNNIKLHHSNNKTKIMLPKTLVPSENNTINSKANNLRSSTIEDNNIVSTHPITHDTLQNDNIVVSASHPLSDATTTVNTSKPLHNFFQPLPSWAHGKERQQQILSPNTKSSLILHTTFECLQPWEEFAIPKETTDPFLLKLKSISTTLPPVKLEAPQQWDRAIIEAQKIPNKPLYNLTWIGRRPGEHDEVKDNENSINNAPNLSSISMDTTLKIIKHYQQYIQQIDSVYHPSQRLYEDTKMINTINGHPQYASLEWLHLQNMYPFWFQREKQGGTTTNVSEKWKKLFLLSHTSQKQTSRSWRDDTLSQMYDSPGEFHFDSESLYNTSQNTNNGSLQNDHNNDKTILTPNQSITIKDYIETPEKETSITAIVLDHQSPRSTDKVYDINHRNNYYQENIVASNVLDLYVSPSMVNGENKLNNVSNEYITSLPLPLDVPDTSWIATIPATTDSSKTAHESQYNVPIKSPKKRKLETSSVTVLNSNPVPLSRNHLSIASDKTEVVDLSTTEYVESMYPSKKRNTDTNTNVINNVLQHNNTNITNMDQILQSDIDNDNDDEINISIGDSDDSDHEITNSTLYPSNAVSNHQSKYSTDFQGLINRNVWFRDLREMNQNDGKNKEILNQSESQSDIPSSWLHENSN